MRLDPRCELAVPNEGVASEDQTSLLGYGGDNLALGEVENALLRLGE